MQTLPRRGGCVVSTIYFHTEGEFTDMRFD
jgi:hypothetical protein